MICAKPAQAQSWDSFLTDTEMILGLTGGMGGGKSTAAGLFEEAGFRVAPLVVAKIAERFPDVVNADGEVQRPLLAKRIFGNDADRLWLEELLHPLVYERWRELLATAPKDRWVIEVPLLFEQGLENWFDFIVCVSTSSANQLARLIERGIPQSLAGQRISKQLPLALKLEKADFVLSNDGTLEALRLQVNHLATRLSGAH
ncbi:MAG: dephospho-CoA kinase [Rariglobus sp.]|nr:dephospho-CoA kinase [Rariglobus sp.]